MSYNGWSNYETWNVALWIDDEEGSSEEVRSMARSATSEAALAKQIEAWVDEMTPSLGASMFSDILGAGLREVNYDEIAGHWYEEAHEDDEEEDEPEEEEVIDG